MLIVTESGIQDYNAELAPSLSPITTIESPPSNVLLGINEVLRMNNGDIGKGDKVVRIEG